MKTQRFLKQRLKTLQRKNNPRIYIHNRRTKLSLLFYITALFSSFMPAAQYSAQLWDGNAYQITINPEKIEQRWLFDPSTINNLEVSKFLRATRPCVSEDGSIVYAYGHISSGTDDGKIVAIDAFYGNIIWSCVVKAEVSLESWSSPVYNNGYIYWAGSDGTGNVHIYKINGKNGSIEESNGGWRIKLPGSAVIANASPTIGGGKVFISTYGGMAPANCNHYALKCSNGSISWSNNDGGTGQGAMAYDANRNVVYQTILHNSTHYLRAYNAENGNIAWTSDWALEFPPYQCAITFKSDKIYVQTYNFSGDGKIYVANAENNGSLIWEKTTPASGDSAPAVAPGGNVYVYGDYSGTGKTRAYDTSGNTLWTCDLAGGWQGSPTWADNYIFTGNQQGNTLRILNDNDGSTAKTVVGSGPVAFAHRTFFTIGTDGILYAYSTSNDYANEVVEYNQGTGVGNDCITNAPFNDKTSALNRPTIDTTGDNSAIPLTEPVPLVNAYPAFRSFELVTIGDGGSLILKFDHPIKNDPANCYGIDFIVFGNAYQTIGGGTSWKNKNPNNLTTGSSISNEPATISVSQDGTIWHEFTNGPFGDDFSPTWGRIYDDITPHRPDNNWDWNNWWGIPTDATLPIYPAWTGATFNGKTVRQTSEMCGKSAGGTGFDISELGLDSIQYVKIIPNLGKPEIDAVSDARIIQDTTPSNTIQNMSITRNETTIELNWENPDDTDFKGVIIIRKKDTAVTNTLPTLGIAYYSDYNKVIDTSDIIYNGSGTTFSDSSLKPGIYNYKIYAYDQVLNYSNSVDGSETVPDNRHNIVFQTDGTPGATLSGTTVQKVNDGENCTSVTADDLIGYHLVNWTGTGGFTATQDNPVTVTNVIADMAVTANFAVNTYTVTYQESANGSITGELIQNIGHGSDATQVTAEANSGYHFTIWSDEVTTVTRTDTNITSDITVIANFAKNDAPIYTLSVINGTGDGKYPADTTLNISTDTAPTGQYFSDWTTSSGGSFSNSNSADTTYTMPDNDATVTANFALNTYTVTFVEGDYGLRNGGGTLIQAVKYGSDALEPTITANPGWSFTGWDTAFTNVTSNLTLSAQYSKISYTLTYTAGENGNITGITPQSLNYGDDGVAVTAVPAENYLFVDWSDASTENPRTDNNVTSDITVTANFTINTEILQLVTKGTVGEVKATDIAGMDAQFTSRPSIYGIYTDPIKGKVNKAMCKGMTKVSKSASVEIFKFEWLRAFALYDINLLKKANRNGISTSDWLTANPIENIIFNFYAKVKTTAKTKIDSVFKIGMMVSPEITSIERWDGGDVSGGVHADSIIVIKGNYFGVKAPAISLEHNQKGSIKLKRLKVQKPYKYANSKEKIAKSCMNVTTGASQIYVEMPKKFWNGWSEGDYSIVLSNKIGIDTYSITTISPSINSAPIANDDTVTLHERQSSYLIDILANDNDAESDKIRIFTGGTTSIKGGKINVCRNSIKYVLPKNYTIPFSDSFIYTISDMHGRVDSATVTITVKSFL
jgi:Big-like domain-containing protein/List-Bact-rpt repeat protein/putative pyrroloquinoline-quinone binding quinoprotein